MCIGRSLWQLRLILQPECNPLAARRETPRTLRTAGRCDQPTLSHHLGVNEISVILTDRLLSHP
jgi:hypothetical protein